MATRNTPNHKSARHQSYLHYLRTGQRLTAAQWLARTEHKFNPNHDERGRFTFAIGEGGGKPGPNGTGQSGKLKPIAGYPEDKKLAWRNANDETFIKAANDFNQRNGLKPGDPRYIDPQMMKAWAMVESGGEGDKAQFLSDPFQVNKPLDWVDAKATQAGLTKWQKMTPAESARAGLEWLRYKSEIHDTSGGVARMLGVQQSLERYNGRSDHSPQSGKQTHKVWYAATIMALAKQP